MGGAYLLLVAAVAPWRGPSRLFIAVGAAVLLVGAGLLILRFMPARRRVVVDCEAGEYRIETMYPLARRPRSLHIPFEAVRAVRRRRRVWQDGPRVGRTEWLVELLGEEGVWTVAVDDDEGAMADLARLIAEVGTCPLEEEA